MMFVRKRTELGLSPPSMQESATYERIAAAHDWKAGSDSRHGHRNEVCGPSKTTKACLSRAPAEDPDTELEELILVPHLSRLFRGQGIQAPRFVVRTKRRTMLGSRVRRREGSTSSTHCSFAGRPEIQHRRPKLLENLQGEVLACRAQEFAQHGLMLMSSRQGRKIDGKGIPAYLTKTRSQGAVA